ncbi:diacylglycerol/lipid kinase family protein [Streptomyces hokutonensis]|uniref:diacylglycerol/lipid kinase family protein n=1 Tax=Streptomyces hokutonensis TaxID=1306990 RepID=UPI0036842E6F
MGGDEAGHRGSRTQRWAARLAITAAVVAVALPLVVAGFRSLGLAAVALAGLALSAAGLWWALSRKGLVRWLAVALAVAVQGAVIALFVAVGLFWLVIVVLVLWAVVCFEGWAALAEDGGRVAPVEYRTAAPERPFLIMNPRSGGGKVGRFGLREKAEALGAQVVLLDPAHPRDVAALARDALANGADLLGVAGGDGTQALVAGVAAEHDVPFMVISAGTRNHFALDLGLDRENPATCLDALTDGVELRVDLGRVGEHTFVNNVSFGAYAEVVQSPAYRDDKIGTILRLLPDILTHHIGSRLKVRGTGVSIDSPQAVLVSNNPYSTDDPVGLGHRERLDTGVLGVLGVNVDNAAQAAELIRGRRSSGLTVATAPTVVIDADAPRVEVGIDGEALSLPTPVHCAIRPEALRVRVPRSRPGVPRTRPRLDWRRLRDLALAHGRVSGGAGTTPAR